MPRKCSSAAHCRSCKPVPAGKAALCRPGQSRSLVKIHGKRFVTTEARYITG